MSVTLVYCEGKPGGDDLRVLTSILAGVATVESKGTWRGLSDAVRQRRSRPAAPVVMGLRDRDFTAADWAVRHTPLPWRPPDGGVLLGWYWERVELENYLLDPAVALRALGPRAPSPDAYAHALERSAASIAAYAAARKAVARCLPSPFPPMLAASWGRERGGNDHPFPDDLSEEACRAYMMETARRHREAHEAVESGIIPLYERLLPLYRPEGDGPAYQAFTVFFPGKDLLWGMEDDLRQLGFDSPVRFLADVVNEIDEAPDPWTWIPEWGALRHLLAATDGYE